MDDSTALHTAARRFCADHFSYWIEQYKELQRNEDWKVDKLFRRGWDYSRDAYRIFPRYRLDKYIEIEIERLTGNLDVAFDQLRALIHKAAAVALEKLAAELTKPIARGALREEYEDFRTYVERLTRNELGNIKPLPFRRVINASESKELFERLGEFWGISGFPWFPLRAVANTRNLIAIHTDYFETVNGDEVLKDAFRSHGIQRLFHLHEFGDPDYEAEIQASDFQYGCGGEVYTTSLETDYLLYASHESSITISGEWLVEYVRRAWPDCEEHSYSGPFSTSDLRGTRKWPSA